MFVEAIVTALDAHSEAGQLGEQMLSLGTCILEEQAREDNVRVRGAGMAIR